MQRSIGVTLIAVVSLIGSLLCLGMGAFTGFMIFLAQAPSAERIPGSPASLKATLSLAVLMYVLLAIWGISTSIGLFRLRNWARISTIVFSVLLTLLSGFTGLVTLVVLAFLPPNGSVSPSIMAEVRIFTGLFWFALMGIGTWWAVFFNRAKVKAQFVTATATGDFPSPAVVSATAVPGTPGQAQRPVSITVIAWLLLVACLFFPLSLIPHTPAILFTKIMTGWPSVGFYAVLIALNLWIGIGLLRLRENARRGAIAYYAFGLLNSAVFNLVPGGTARVQAFMDAQPQMFAWRRTMQIGQLPQFDPILFMKMGTALGVIAAMVPLYFLVTRKYAFDKVSTAANSAEAS